ncbi:hypothetical protein [Actinocrispum wychmicini]|uniref:Uncharacterized protein n=1 Tax=Actinocrispum wychmicini TaxID=1213861 RepID=A0A4R2JNP0_9PSEU|nr:hypothetical protein [Actinocrispum wychmicini]TCO60587.1 hypothetical protein EV192_103162 [Actinocrispum wychmicini]
MSSTSPEPLAETDLPMQEVSSEELSDEATDRDPVGYMRFLPAVTFGLRVAALAGVALAVGDMAGVTGIWPGGTTCCITINPT